MDPKIQKLVQNVQKSDPKVRKTDHKILKMNIKRYNVGGEYFLYGA